MKDNSKRKVYTAERNNKRKSRVLLSSLVIALMFVVGVTTAYLMTNTNSITNTFQPAQVACAVYETFDGTTKENVKIKNTGNTEAYIRAAVVVTWKDGENGYVYGSAPVAGKDYEININSGDWFMASDGYYYYKKPVAAGGETGVLISSCTAVQGKAPVGYGLNVEILCTAIQSTPTDFVTERWQAVTVNSVGELTPKSN